MPEKTIPKPVSSKGFISAVDHLMLINRDRGVGEELRIDLSVLPTNPPVVCLILIESHSSNVPSKSACVETVTALSSVRMRKCEVMLETVFLFVASPNDSGRHVTSASII